MNNKIWFYFKNYKWNSIFFSYFKSVVILILIPFILLSGIIFTYYNHITINNRYTQYSSSLYQVKSQMDTLIYSASNIYSSICLQNAVIEYMNKTDILESNGFSRTILYRQVFNTISNYLSSNQLINSIYLYNASAGYVIGTNAFCYIDNMQDSSWLELFKENNSSSYMKARRVTLNGVTYNYLTFCYQFSFDNSPDCLVVINYNIDEINTLIQTNNESCTVIDSYNSILISKSTDLLNSRISIDNYKRLLSYNKNIEFYKSDVSLLLLLRSVDNNLVYMYKINKNYSRQEMLNICLLIIFSLILSIILSALLSFILSIKLYKMIINIMDAISDPNNVAETKSRKNEMTYIIDQIIDIKNNFKSSEEIIASKLIALRKSQTIALQTQITPHFLYNTLQAINIVTLRLCKGDNDASKMIMLFSDLLYISLDTITYIVPLEKEIIHAKKYIELQQIKYSDSFAVYWDIPKELYNANIIKISLQPIIENALYHGIFPSSKKGHIYISATIDDQDMVIAVKNDGIVIPDEILFEVQKSLSDDELPETKKIGLLNVHQRIRLIYGDSYGCTITSVNQMTVVKIILPLNKSN